jgi:hypothetical protein
MRVTAFCDPQLFTHHRGICSVTWYRSQRLNYQYTVCQGGKSAGRCRYAHPVRTTNSDAHGVRRPYQTVRNATVGSAL